MSLKPLNLLIYNNDFYTKNNKTIIKNPVLNVAIIVMSSFRWIKHFLIAFKYINKKSYKIEIKKNKTFVYSDNINIEGEKYFFFISVIFTFIVFNNLIGLISYSFTVTSHLFVTFTFFFSNFICFNISIKTNSFSFFSIENCLVSTRKLLKENFQYLKTQHSFHPVDPSPWPLVASLGVFMLTTGGVLYMHKFVGGERLLLTGLFVILYSMYTWWRDVIREATFEEQHTVAVQKGLRLGMVLFIVSEIMFFFVFLGAFFHSSLAPVLNIGGVSSPEAISPIKTSGISLTNTFFLLSSGATAIWAHHAIVVRAKMQAIIGLNFTLILAVLFTGLQVLEYMKASFCVSDSVFGSYYYIATGFHVFLEPTSLFVLHCDDPMNWQISLSEPASITMEGILMFNKHFLFFLIVIILFIGWLLYNTIFFYEEFTNKFNLLKDCKSLNKYKLTLKKLLYVVGILLLFPCTILLIFTNENIAESSYMMGNSSSSCSGGDTGLPGGNGSFGAEDPNDPDKPKDSKNGESSDGSLYSSDASEESLSDSDMDLDLETYDSDDSTVGYYDVLSELADQDTFDVEECENIGYEQALRDMDYLLPDPNSGIPMDEPYPRTAQAWHQRLNDPEFIRREEDHQIEILQRLVQDEARRLQNPQPDRTYYEIIRLSERYPALYEEINDSLESYRLAVRTSDSDAIENALERLNRARRERADLDRLLDSLARDSMDDNS